jgi:D-3-phosphoglycerate dehydrogenase / 2-oxoglutarate reductase
MTFKIAAPDGIDAAAKSLFESSDLFQWIETESWKSSGCDFLIIRSATKINSQLIEDLPELKFVIRAGVGTDNIDFDACDKHGVAVWNAPEGNFQSTAELAIGMIFSLFRGIPEATATTKLGEWKKADLSKRGRQLSGSKLGVLGLGNIGLRVARMAKALGMEVIGSDPFYKGTEFQAVSLEEMFKTVDVVSTHLPFTPATKGIVSRSLLESTKPGFFLVNTARGGLVDEKDLIDLLASGHLGGVGLDVFSEEPLNLKDASIKKLASFANVVLSPHIGAATKEAQRAVGMESWQKASRIAEDVKAQRDFQDRPLLLPKLARWR